MKADAVELLKQEFPLMDNDFLIKCLRPSESGGQLTERARNILNTAKITRKRTEKAAKRYMFRADISQVTSLEQAKKYLNIKTDQLILNEAVEIALDYWGIYEGGKNV